MIRDACGRKVTAKQLAAEIVIDCTRRAELWAQEIEHDEMTEHEEMRVDDHVTKLVSRVEKLLRKALKVHGPG